MLKTIKNLLIAAVLGLSATVWAEVDLNSANKAELQALKGIGPKKAEDIIAYREAHGGFKSVDELLNVKGVGKATLEKLRSELVVDNQPAEEAKGKNTEQANDKSEKKADKAKAEKNAKAEKAAVVENGHEEGSEAKTPETKGKHREKAEKGNSEQESAN